MAAESGKAGEARNRLVVVLDLSVPSKGLVSAAVLRRPKDLGDSDGDKRQVGKCAV